MKLWVRSQDKIMLKQSLTQNNEFCIQFSGSKNDCYDIIFNDFYMGRYATKERCIEILDEIQKILCNVPMLVNEQGKDALDKLCYDGLAVADNNASAQPLNTVVYQMPEK